MSFLEWAVFAYSAGGVATAFAAVDHRGRRPPIEDYPFIVLGWPIVLWHTLVD